MIPIFPELRQYLEDVDQLASPGTEFVITRYRDSNANLRTQLERILAKAGLKPRPKLFQNLRSTRETELAKTYPMHVVCDWIGNTQAVAQKHYLQVTDAHFEHAAGGALQNCATDAVQPDANSDTDKPADVGLPGIASIATDCAALQTAEVGGTGHQQRAILPRTMQICKSRAPLAPQIRWSRRTQCKCKVHVLINN